MTQRKLKSGFLAALFAVAVILSMRAAPAADAIPKSDEIVRKYIPAARLDAVATKDSPGVILPIAEFETLLKEVGAKIGDSSSRPAGAGLVRADYALRLAEERLVATCRIQIRSFDATWQTLRLHVGGLSVLSAKYEGSESAPTLSRDAEKPDELILLMAEPGAKTLVLELAAPVSAAGGDSAATFQLVNAPLGEMSLTLPPKKRLRLDGVLLERPAADDKPADYKVAIGGRSEARLIITDRAAIDRTDAMTFASTTFGVVASPGEATWTARTQLSVFGRPLDKLECEVPSSLEITDVQSQGLEAWQLNDGAPGRTRISLTWRQPFDGVRPITFRGVFSPDRDGRWHVPNLVLHSISSHTGRLLIERPAGVRLQILHTAGLRPVAAEGAEAKPSVTESRNEIWREDFALDFVPAAKEREVQAAMSTLLSFNAQGADLMTTIDLETRFAPLFEADIVLPVAWQILEARHGDQPAKWQQIPAEAGRNRIRISLEPPLKPGENRTLRLMSHFEPDGWPVAATPIRVVIPEVRLPQAGVVEALYGVTAESDLEVIPIDVAGLIPARQSDVDTLNRQLASFGKTVRLGFTYQDTAFQGQLEIRRLPPRMTATCITLTRIDAEEVASHVEAQLAIGGGGVRELHVRLPEFVGRDLRFVLTHFQPRALFGVQAAPQVAVQQAVRIMPPLPIILEQKAGAVDNGFIPWTIKLDRYALGTFVLQAEVTQRRNQAAAGQVQQWTVPALSVAGADRESGAIGIEAADDQYVRTEARDSSGQPLEAVDPIDFPPAHVQPRERLVAAYAYERPGWTVAVSEERLTRIAMPTAVIHNLALASIVGPDGVKQVQADATLSAVGIQSLVVRLPEGNTLWAALVDGSPIQVHKSGTALSLPLSPVDPPSRARQVRLIYAPADGHTAVHRRLSGFSIEEAPPQFLVVTGQGSEKPLTVLASQWTVHHSDDLDLVETDGVFHPAHPLERDSLLHRLMALFRIPESGDVFWRVAVLAGIGLVFWLIASMKRNVPKATLGCLLGTVVLIGLFILMLPAVQQSREAARRYGNDTKLATDAPPPPAMAPQATPSFNDFSFQDRFAVPAKDADADGMIQLKQNQRLVEDGRRESLMKERLSDEFKARAGDQPQSSVEAGEKSQKSLDLQSLFDTSPQGARPSGGAAPTRGFEMFGGTTLAIEDPKAAAATGRGLVRGEGLLSVTFGLQPPTGSHSAVLESTSDDPAKGLSIRFMDEKTRNLWTGFTAIATAVLGWWLRKSTFTTRLLYLLITLLGPVSMRWLMPLAWLPLADGIWLGGVATALLWLLRGLVAGICDCPCMTRWCRPKSSVTAPLIALTTLAWAPWALAQPAAPVAAPAKPAPAAPAPEVFIPYDNPREPLSAKNVFIPQDLFLKLWRTAHPEDLPPTKPPVPATISAAAFVVDLTGLPDAANADGRRATSVAPVTARLVLKNLTTGLVWVALPIKGVAIRSATLNGAPAVIVTRNDKSLAVDFEQPGDSVLDLQFDVAVERTGPAGRIRWDSSAVPAGLLTLKLPASDAPPEVRVAGNKVSPTGPAAAGSISYEIPVDRGGVQDIAWQPATARSGDDSPVQIQAVSSVAVDDGGLRIRSEYTAKVSQKGVTELVLAFPGPMNLVRVEGRDIGGWRVEGEAAARKLTVFFSRKIEAQTVFTVEAFQGVAVDEKQQTLTVLPPQPEGVSREAGEIGVYVAPHLSVRPGAVVGLAQQDVTRFAKDRPTAAENPLQLAYRYAARPISLELVVQRRQVETRADLQHGVFLTQRKLRISTRAVLHVAGAPRSSLSLSLPAGYLLLDVTSPAMADYSTADGEGGRKILTIEFDRPRTGDVELLLDGSLARRPEEPSSVVMVPRLVDVNKIDSQLAIWIDDVYVATADALGDWKNADPNSLDEKLRSLRPTSIQFGFRSTSADPQPVTIGLRAQAAELSADVLSLIAVSNSSVDYGLTMQWKITRAATDTFSFTTPGWLRGRLDFAGAGIRQVLSSDVAGDRVKWTVSLTDPVRDAYLLTAAASLPSPADGRILAPDISFESSGAGGAATRLEAQRHFAVMVNLSRRPLALEDPAAVETVRREALPLKVPDLLVRQATNIVQVLPGKTATWLARRVGEAASLQATITGAKLETVVELDGSWRTQATYTLRNRGRQFLPVDLSAMGEVRVLSILVKGKPARALETKVGAKSLHLVPLPPSSAADLSYDVVVMLAGKLAKGLPKETSIASTTLELPAPHITTPTESGQFGMSVAQTAWIVKLPDGVKAEIDETGNLTPHQAAEWDLLADAQFLSQVESDAAEMIRIISDVGSSEQRKGQAANNLRQLGVAIQYNRSKIQENSQKAAELLGERGVELSRDNWDRTQAIEEKLAMPLRDYELKQKHTQNPFAEANQQQQPVPQLQGTLNFSDGDLLTNGVINAPQSGEGRAYILGNSASIITSNSFNSEPAKDSLSVDFGFNAPALKAGAKPGQAPPMPGQPADEKSGKAPASRSGLKRKLAEQQQAAQGANMGLGFRQQDQSRLGSGGMGGGGIGGGGGFGRFSGSMAGQPRDAIAESAPRSPVTMPFGANGPPGFGGRIDGNAIIAGRAGQLELDAAAAAIAVPSTTWAGGAGLSLAMTLPAVGEDSLAFSKVGGDPKLVLMARSTEARRAAWGLGEVAAALLVAIALLSAAASTTLFARRLSMLVAIAAAAAFLFLPGGAGWLALGVLVLAAWRWAYVNRRANQAAVAG